MITLFLGVVCLAGCGPQFPADWPKTYPCTITVTQDGQPMEGVTLYLTRTENHGSWAVAGITNSSGVAVIETSWTHAASRGAPEGTFSVSASMPTPPYVQSISDDELNAMPYDRRTAFLEADMRRHQREFPGLPPSLSVPGMAGAPQIEVIPGTPATLTIEINDFR